MKLARGKRSIYHGYDQGFHCMEKCWTSKVEIENFSPPSPSRSQFEIFAHFLNCPSGINQFMYGQHCQGDGETWPLFLLFCL